MTQRTSLEGSQAFKCLNWGLLQRWSAHGAGQVLQCGLGHTEGTLLHDLPTGYVQINRSRRQEPGLGIQVTTVLSTCLSELSSDDLTSLS